MGIIRLHSELIDEVMAHSLYPTEEELGFGQHCKREACLPVSRPVRIDSQHGAMERTASYMSPASEDNKSRPGPRRRIQVACNRCRKRKIKCSGDTGDGLGCSNCRSSGNNNCHFLRVNSSMLQTKPNWGPYPAMNSTVSQSPRIGGYVPHMTSRQPMNPRAPSHSRQPGYDMGLFDSQSMFSRQSFGLDNSVNYEDDSAAFNTQSPGYMLPSTPQGAVDYSGLPWNQKTWSSNFHDSKTQNGGLFPDQEPESALSQPTYSYMLPGQEVPSAEMTPVVPTMSLPCDEQGTERTLPNPGNRNHQLPSNMPVITTTQESMSNLQFSQGFRIGSSWAPRPVPASVRAAVQPISNEFSVSPANRAKLNMPTAQDLGFGFMPITTADSSPAITSSGAVAKMEAVDSSEPRVRNFSRDNGRLLGMADYTPDIYGYSTGEKNKNRADESATLMSGMAYTRVRHPDTNLFPFHLLPSEAIPDYRPATEAHRTSISPVGNPNGY